MRVNRSRLREEKPRQAMRHRELPQGARPRDGHPRRASASCTGSSSTKPEPQPLDLQEGWEGGSAPAASPDPGSKSRLPSRDGGWTDPAGRPAIRAADGGSPRAGEKSRYCNSLALQNSFPFISLLSVHGADPPWGPEAPGALQNFASWAGLPEAGHPKASHRLAGPACQPQTGEKIQYVWQKQRAEERKTDAVSSAFGHAHTRT